MYLHSEGPTEGDALRMPVQWRELRLITTSASPPAIRLA
jgi:hypothetical protein